MLYCPVFLNYDIKIKHPLFIYRNLFFEHNKSESFIDSLFIRYLIYLENVFHQFGILLDESNIYLTEIGVSPVSIVKSFV